MTTNLNVCSSTFYWKYTSNWVMVKVISHLRCWYRCSQFYSWKDWKTSVKIGKHCSACQKSKAYRLANLDIKIENWGSNCTLRGVKENPCAPWKKWPNPSDQYAKQAVDREVEEQKSGGCDGTIFTMKVCSLYIRVSILLCTVTNFLAGSPRVGSQFILSDHSEYLDTTANSRLHRRYSKIK